MDTVDRIKELAKKRGWSLQKVAEKAGIGINSIYRWNSKTPSTQSLLKKATRPLTLPMKKPFLPMKAKKYHQKISNT